MKRGKGQFGNQGGRTITIRLNHKEVIFLLCFVWVHARWEKCLQWSEQKSWVMTYCADVHKQAISY